MRLVIRGSPGDTPIGPGWLVVLADQGCEPHYDFSWSHLWSHSRRFRGVRNRLPSRGSGATRPDRTGLNHQPQNSKAGEIRARSESHEIAVSECADCASDRSDGNSRYRRMPGQGPRRKTEPGCKRRAGTPTEGVPPLPVSVLVSVVHVRRRSRACHMHPTRRDNRPANRRGPRFADLVNGLAHGPAARVAASGANHAGVGKTSAYRLTLSPTAADAPRATRNA